MMVSPKTWRSPDHPIVTEIAAYLAPHVAELHLTKVDRTDDLWMMHMAATCSRCGEQWSDQFTSSRKVLAGDMKHRVADRAADHLRKFCKSIANQLCVSNTAISVLAERITKLILAVGPLYPDELDAAYRTMYSEYLHDPAISRMIRAVCVQIGFLTDLNPRVCLPVDHPLYQTGTAF